MSYTFALAGNPNCGKTTLFNELTGSNQYVGNWAGVTVEKKEGRMNLNGSKDHILVDLPGIYSLSPYTMEEIVARDFIINEKPDVIINIVDATNIERNLYLTLQLIELGCPVVVAMNMIDDLNAKGDRLDCTKMSRLLGVPVVPIVARKAINLDSLIEACIRLLADEREYKPNVAYDAATQTALSQILTVVKQKKDIDSLPLAFFAGKLLEGDQETATKLGLTTRQIQSIEQVIKQYEHQHRYPDRDTMLADARYSFITTLVGHCMQRSANRSVLTRSDQIDRVLTNRFLAIPIFMLIMFTMFSMTFGRVGTAAKSIVEHGIGFFAEQVSGLLVLAQAPAWTESLLVDAVIGGVGSVLTFLPQIMLLFLFLSIMEDSGYMSRAAFIMDRLLRKLGLTGKSFIPMLMGFGCTTPAVMAARSMENEKDRKLTIMLTPFMSCGAKLPIYALFAGIFFPSHQGLVVFSMYIMGMVVAILAGLFLKNTLFSGKDATFVMELPSYRLPTLKSTMLHMWDKCKGFLIKAGTILFSMSIIIWLLQNFNLSLQLVEDSSQSIFGQFGQWISPIFAPMGITSWKAVVSLLSGLIAKEAVVSTLGVLLDTAGSHDGLAAALQTIFTPLSAFSYMAFCLLYVPCISAFVSIKREMNSLKWALGSAVFQTTIAYAVAVAIYQIGLFIFR